MLASSTTSEGRPPHAASSGLTLMLMLALLLPIGETARAQSGTSESILMDLSREDDTLVVWADASSLLKSSVISRLRDGIGLRLECRAWLRRPRRMLGSEEIAYTSKNVLLAYQVATEQYTLSIGLKDSIVDIWFPSLARVSAYLTDSLGLPIIPLDSLSPSQRYEVKLRVTAISIAGMSLEDPEEGSGSGSPLGFLFRQFLEITGYGREDYSTKSRQFSISELTPR